MAFAENKATPIAIGDLGLDRTRINAEDQVQLISEPSDISKPANGFVNGSINAPGANGILYGNDTSEQDPGPLSKRKRLSLSAKKVLHIGNDSSNKPLPAPPILADAPQTDSDSRLVYDSPIKEKNKLKDLAHDPVDTIKSKATGQGGHQAASNLAAKEISHGRDVELVRAHDEIARAKTETEKLLAIKNVDEMMAARQDMFVRWTIDRHITKVRILPRNTVRLRAKREFIRKGTDGKEKMDWESYIVHVCQSPKLLSNEADSIGCGILLREILWRVHWLYRQPTFSDQGGSSTKCGTSVGLFGTISRACYDNPPDIPLGKSQQDSKISYWIFYPLGPEPGFTRLCTLSPSCQMLQY